MYKISIAALLVLSSCATEPELYQAHEKSVLAAAHARAMNDATAEMNAHPTLWNLRCWDVDSKIKSGDPVKFVRFQKVGPRKYPTVGYDYEDRMVGDNVSIPLEAVFEQNGVTDTTIMTYSYTVGKDDSLSAPTLPGPMPFPSCLKDSDPIAQFRKNPKALHAIEKEEFYIGMSEDAFLASQGKISFNLMNYHGRQTKQYVKGNHYFYVENGNLTDYQLF